MIRDDGKRAKALIRRPTIVGVAPPSAGSQAAPESAPQSEDHRRYSLVRVKRPDGIPGVTGARSAELKKVR